MITATAVTAASVTSMFLLKPKWLLLQQVLRHLIKLLLLKLLLLKLLLLKLPQLCVVVEGINIAAHVSSTEATYSTATARLRLQATTAAVVEDATTAAADPLLSN